MTLEEAYETEVSREEAIREIRKHGLNPADFFAYAGERETYEGSEVLGWLGY
jgi:hypothetical protein